MDETQLAEIREWAVQIQQYTPISLDRMPELQLYMDQVIAFMEKQLDFYRRNAQSKTLTPSMINNYVKESLLDRPVNKRYDRTHLAQLMMISMLKPVLSIADIARLTQAIQPTLDAEQLYMRFSEAQTAAVQSVGQHLEQLFGSDNPTDRSALALLAMQLGLQANAYRIAAEKLLETLQANGDKTPPPKEKKEKGK